MAKKTQGPGIQSAAGLIRYFDSDEDTNIKMRPSFVLFFSAAVGIAAVCVRIFWKL
ncbi:MAG: preprotein translocase subunit Sec61beta [Candidatus Thermoplasmatota archaeon]